MCIYVYTYIRICVSHTKFIHEYHIKSFCNILMFLVFIFKSFENIHH